MRRHGLSDRIHLDPLYGWKGTEAVCHTPCTRPRSSGRRRLGQRPFRCHSGRRLGNWERLTLVTTLIQRPTHPFVESEFSQLIALFVAWRQDLDSEPFAYEDEWATVDSPVYDAVAGWPPRTHPPEASRTS